MSSTLSFSGQSGQAQLVVVAVNPERRGQPAEQFSLVLSNVQAQGRAVTLLNQGTAGVTLPGAPTSLDPGEQPPGLRRLFLPYLQP
ncbi:MAG TPA: hypothetical protein VNK95_14210 [Caldilineaceae bacterium]|nr:hypothetical protein [Caldilineaceae bacterium]